MICDHAPAANPRLGGSCVKCGREYEPVPPGPAIRSVSLERAFTEAATTGTINAARLVALAEARALPGPLRDFADRDFDLDGLEEGSDWRNYLVWRLQQIRAFVEAGRIHPETALQKERLLLEALKHVAIAFTFVEQSREL